MSTIYPIIITGVPGQTITTWGISGVGGYSKTAIIAAPDPPYKANVKISNGCSALTGVYDSDKQVLTIKGKCPSPIPDFDEIVNNCVVANSAEFGTYLSAPGNTANVNAINSISKNYLQTTTPVMAAIVNNNYAIWFWLAILIITMVIILLIHKGRKKLNKN